MQTAIHAIIQAGAAAPSVANSQPWRFSASGNYISLHLDRNRANSLGNTGYALIYSTFGGVVENMEIASRRLGFSPETIFTPFSGNDDTIARIKLTPAPQGESSLYECIQQRYTNRRLFSTEPIAPHFHDSLTATARQYKTARLLWLDSSNALARLAKIVSVADSLMYEHPRLHYDLFKWIRWTAEEAERNGDGMLLETLEVNLMERAALKLLSFWSIMRIINIFNGSRFPSAHISKLVKASAAVGLVVMDEATPESYFRGGAFFERIWLMATAHGLALHPICPITVLPEVCNLLGEKAFSRKQQKLLQMVQDEFLDIFRINKNNAQIILFRIGYAAPPTARSNRRPLKEIFVS